MVGAAFQKGLKLVAKARLVDESHSYLKRLGIPSHLLLESGITYIYIYIERESKREREREKQAPTQIANKHVNARCLTSNSVHKTF